LRDLTEALPRRLGFRQRRGAASLAVVARVLMLIEYFWQEEDRLAFRHF
jgi:hypothetical protein